MSSSAPARNKPSSSTAAPSGSGAEHAEEESEFGNDTPLPQQQQQQKRRRRAFSCLSCQKLKCRCEYDPGALGCHRCQTLRIECSLKGETVSASPQSRNNDQASGSSVEERLQRHEETLREIKSMIKDIASQRPLLSEDRRAETSGSKGGGHHDDARAGGDMPKIRADSPELFSVPADKGTNTAPIVVLREISAQVNRGYRRLLGHVHADLVQLQLLDEQTANDVIHIFFRHQSHTLLTCGIEELTRPSESRKVSAFLYNVCCLIGMGYREDLCGTSTHRLADRLVRITLGQYLLSSPLNLEEINAVFMMSNNGNTPSPQGSDYVDSWLLTGYCAQQAMLSISFSNIVNHIQNGNSTVEDHRAIHLWSTICLHHLHWAATTGRPSIIPIAYINQCNILLSFYQATMQDGMLVAEILLYSTLHQKLGQQSYQGDGGECEEFLDWKQKWNHLLALSTSSMLRIGYHAACLILAIRSLEEMGQGIETKTFLSEAVSDHHHDRFGGNSSQSQNRDERSDLLRANACKYAMLVLQTFLDMPTFLMDAIPVCFCLCIGYCALVLAHYDETRSKISDQVSLDLVTRLDQWIRASAGKAWIYKYGALAKRKVESRINGIARSSAAAYARGGGGGSGHRARDDRRGISVPVEYHAAGLGSADHHSAEAAFYGTEELVTPNSHSLDNLQSFPDLTDAVAFPSMEDFFGGGFLQYMK
ncbi:hypothetical protein F4778DRAFT_774000 [Xylariomycetidae sp. FL2044]|nr:hypothetical protein F4778DRAFT_774000 [Xylariomycetidae sp. FL2044]